MTQERLDRLLEAVRDADSILILPHNNPDPDAIAASVALRHLLVERPDVEVDIVYQGIIGRAENKAMVRYLGNPLRRLLDSDLHGTACVALIDTQPGAGNNALPPHVAPVIVLDHHPLIEGTVSVAFADVRPDRGAVSTILVEYLQMTSCDIPPALATALFYGIKTDTHGLSQNASPADVAAYFYLQPQVDVEALAEVEHAQVPADYFNSFDAALHAARLHDGVVTAYIGPMDYPDMAAEMADILLRLEKCQWVLCMGEHRGSLIVSVRTRDQRGGAEYLVQAIVGLNGTAGGHGMMAGGQIPLDDEFPEHMARQVSRHALQYLGIPPEGVGEPLI